MAIEKPGFYIWFKTVDQMAEMTFEEKGMIYTAVEEYARNGALPEFDDRFLRSIWARLKSDLDEDDAKYRKTQRDNQIKGWKSDFKRNYAPAHGIDPNDEAALDAYIQQRSTAVDCGQHTSSNTNTNPNINPNSNTSINTNININSNPNTADDTSAEQKQTYGEFQNVLLTDDELEKLKGAFPADWQERIESLSSYMKSTGKKYESHYATLKRWEMKENQARPIIYPTQGKPSKAEEMDSFYNMAANWAKEDERKVGTYL